MKSVTNKSGVAFKMHQSSAGVLAPEHAVACIRR